ncbi:ABC transporter substrate-binding protein [Aeromicrobium ponti]|uniref:Peptide/nickel transport system substrate-binding protein n=1 Tax=Cytobacillus oceanisediminis TaxID=665099 RepID=A0A562K6S4_9BACI|nr:ABC transporter substrate-binding protein [Cytobacillus oceanisediminis]TWH91122.1 peptide/nickel transport system substrate-binding protein [Cytobacillus oceanisediminis]
MKRSAISMGLIFLFLLSSLNPVHAAETVQSLKVGITKDENGLNPYTYVTGYPGLDLVNLLYDTLFNLDENNQPEPWLVKEYKVSEDGLTYELTLHENIKWHDGKPLTANDVKFTMDYFIKYPKSRFTNPLKTIKSIEVTSETAITLYLSQADPNFMIQPLADLPILPEHIWSNVSNPDDETNALGSGPYILVEHKSGQYYKMKSNNEYFKGAPPINEMIFPIIEDTTAMYNALQAGELDAISSSISPELVEQFSSNPALQVVRGPGYSTSLFQLNAEKYPMTETAFRQAIDYAIDKEGLVNTVLLGYAEVGSPGFIHPSSAYFNSEVKPVYDKEKAKQILEDAGFIDKDGDGFREDQKGNKIDLTTLVYSGNPIRIRTAELISEALNEIGIKNAVKAMDSTTVDSLMWPDFDVSKGRDYDLGVWSWSNTMQLFPDRMNDLFHSDPAIGSVNIGGYKNPEFDQMGEKLKGTYDEKERLSLIKDMQAFVANDAPIITLYYQEIVGAFNPAKYDQYVFQVGKGIINKLSFVSSEKSNLPGNEKVSNDSAASTDSKTANTSTENEGNNTSLYVFGFVVLVAVVGFVLLRRKKKDKGKDDFGF